MPVINFKSPSKKIVRKSLENILVKDYMSKEIISFHKSDSIFEVKKVLLEKKISGAPVISKSGKLIGIISETDIMKQIIDSNYLIIFYVGLGCYYNAPEKEYND